MSNTVIPYKTGFTVKPKEVSPFGFVTFTDGTRDITPNQLQCEAYGYTFNTLDGTCSAFRYNTILESSVANENNRTFGVANTTGTGTNNTLVMGESNNVVGLSQNSIIIGSKNEIASGISNANVSGTLGEVTATNSTVLGGNSPEDILGKRQSIRLMYGKTTTAASQQASNLNNTAASFFVVPNNTIIYFHASCLAVRVGGTSGSGAVGDYHSSIERGVIINKSGVVSIQRERDVIKTSGTTTGWNPTAKFSGTNFFIAVKGAANMTVEWACDIKLTQIKAGVTL